MTIPGEFTPVKSATHICIVSGHPHILHAPRRHAWGTTWSTGASIGFPFGASLTGGAGRASDSMRPLPHVCVNDATSIDASGLEEGWQGSLWQSTAILTLEVRLQLHRLPPSPTIPECLAVLELSSDRYAVQAPLLLSCWQRPVLRAVGAVGLMGSEEADKNTGVTTRPQA